MRALISFREFTTPSAFREVAAYAAISPTLERHKLQIESM